MNWMKDWVNWLFLVTGLMLALAMTKEVYLQVWIMKHPCKVSHRAEVFHPANMEMIPGKTPILVPHAAFARWEDVCDER